MSEVIQTLKLREYSQDEINAASEEFDILLEILPLVLQDIIKFSTPKNSINTKKILHKRIIEQIKTIEDSFCYPIFLELFGVNYEFSNLNPKFIDVFKGITPSSLPTLPWAYNRIIYKESQEKNYFNIKDTKTLKTNQSDFEEIIKFKPNEFLVLFSRMNDSLRSSRCSELMEIYLALSLAKDFGFEVNSIDYQKGELKKTNLDELKQRIFSYCKSYYSKFEEYAEKENYKDPVIKDLNYDSLIIKSLAFKSKIIEFRNRDLRLFENFDKEEKDLFCWELKDILEINKLDITIAPSSPTVNKLFGGSGLTKKIGEKIDGGYSSFAKYYQNEWILSNLNSEFNVISSNLESATRKDNPLL